jgi:hypothetical protein
LKLIPISWNDHEVWIKGMATMLNRNYFGSVDVGDKTPRVKSLIASSFTPTKNTQGKFKFNQLSLKFPRTKTKNLFKSNSRDSIESL